VCAPSVCSRARAFLLGSADEPLSEKLDRSEGVICPPVAVDPEIDRVAAARWRQDAGHSAARKPGRRSDRKAEERFGAFAGANGQAVAGVHFGGNFLESGPGSGGLSCVSIA
jgi:hypothetical protein